MSDKTASSYHPKEKIRLEENLLRYLTPEDIPLPIALEAAKRGALRVEDLQFAIKSLPENLTDNEAALRVVDMLCNSYRLALLDIVGHALSMQQLHELKDSAQEVLTVVARSLESGACWQEALTSVGAKTQ